MPNEEWTTKSSYNSLSYIWKICYKSTVLLFDLVCGKFIKLKTEKFIGQIWNNLFFHKWSYPNWSVYFISVSCWLYFLPILESGNILLYFFLSPLLPANLSFFSMESKASTISACKTNFWWLSDLLLLLLNWKLSLKMLVVLSQTLHSYYAQDSLTMLLKISYTTIVYGKFIANTTVCWVFVSFDRIDPTESVFSYTIILCFPFTHYLSKIYIKKICYPFRTAIALNLSYWKPFSWTGWLLLLQLIPKSVSLNTSNYEKKIWIAFDWWSIDDKTKQYM